MQSIVFYDAEILNDMPRVVEVCNTARINPTAMEAFRQLLEWHRSGFHEAIPTDSIVQLQFIPDTRGYATAGFFGRGGLLATSFLLTGRDPAAEKLAIQQVQPALFRAFMKTAIEPGFNLHLLEQRPLHATVFLPYRETPENIRDAMIVATARVHLAGAFFLQHAEKSD